MEGISGSQRILRYAQIGRDIVQHFGPLKESLEWELGQVGQVYLRQRENKAFISDVSLKTSSSDDLQ